MNLNKLRDSIHDNAVKHGFWEGERSIAECLVLIHSEVSEALEADRKDRHAGDLDAENGMLIETLGWKEWFESYIKDTFEDELADVVIRCLDLCGHLEIDVDKEMESQSSEGIFSTDRSTADKLFTLHSWITFAAKYGFKEEYTDAGIVDIIDVTLELARHLNIDIEKHIELKMRYNESREYKHGNKY